jgi:hypothetical protein
MEAVLPRAFSISRQNGFTNVANLTGGMLRWHAEAHPVEGDSARGWSIQKESSFLSSPRKRLGMHTSPLPACGGGQGGGRTQRTKTRAAHYQAGS